MLGRCCRGWGQQRDEGRREEGRREEGRGRLQSDSRGCPMVPRPPKPSYHSDPLQRYGAGPRQLPLSPLKRARQAAMGGGRLDVGTFLVGVEVSGRESTPRATEGLLGPLTNGEWAARCYILSWARGMVGQLDTCLVRAAIQILADIQSVSTVNVFNRCHSVSAAIAYSMSLTNNVFFVGVILQAIAADVNYSRQLHVTVHEMFDFLLTCFTIAKGLIFTL